MENTSAANGQTSFNSWMNGKWIAENSGWAMEMYAKQLKTLASILADTYQLYSPSKSSGNWTDFTLSDWNTFYQPFRKLYGNYFFPVSGSGNILEQINRGYVNTLERITQLNQDLFSSFQKQLQHDEKDLSQFNQTIEKFINEQLQLSRQYMDTLNTAINNRISFQSDIGKKIMDSMSKQQEWLYEQNKKMMEEWNTFSAYREKTETSDKQPKQKKKEELVPA